MQALLMQAVVCNVNISQQWMGPTSTVRGYKVEPAFYGFRNSA